MINDIETRGSITNNQGDNAGLHPNTISALCRDAETGETGDSPRVSD
jgi:hypothetical protein